LLVGVALLLALGCRGGASSPTPTPPPPRISPSPPPAAPAPTRGVAAATPDTAGAAATRPAAGPSPSPAACGYGPATRLTALQDRAVAEASGLAASRRTPGAYWTLNDSNNEPRLFAFDRTGRALGTFRVEGAQNSDWEALQAGPGPNGAHALYVGDIGDNQAHRQDIQVYRLPEPALDLTAAKPSSGVARPVERFFLFYPDGAHDAEALLVHPTSGELLIVTKSFAGLSSVYRAPPLSSRERVGLEHVAEVDLTGLGLLAGVVTDAAYAPDARRIALRTYVAALEYDVPSSQDPAATWSQPPHVYPLQDGRQGEGITYRPDGRALLTIGEGSPAQVYALEWGC
jgi:hypothetical protein